MSNISLKNLLRLKEIMVILMQNEVTTLTRECLTANLQKILKCFNNNRWMQHFHGCKDMDERGDETIEDPQMNPSLLEKCQEVLDKIKARPTSEWFNEASDSEDDDIKNYKAIIREPYYIDTVQTKLTEGKYEDVASFKEDLATIWNNYIKCYGEESLFGNIALDMKQFSEKLLVFISDSPEIDWINELVYLVEELSSAVKPLNFSSFSGKKRSSSTSSIKQYDIQSVDDSFEEEAYPQEELEKIGAEINSLKKESDILAIFNCLKENLPRQVGNKTFVEADISTFPTRVIKALENKLEEIKKAPEETTDSENAANTSSGSRITSDTSSDDTSSSSESTEESTESD